MAFVLSALTGGQAEASCLSSEKTTVTFNVQTEKKIFFQPESDEVTGYTAVKPGETVTLELTRSAYYYYVDTRSKFHTVFVSPGTCITINEADGKVTFEGDHAETNSYLQTHPAHINVPQEITPYSDEWVNYRRKEVERQIADLQASGLPADFVRIHSLYYRYSNIQQLIVSPETARMFGGKKVDLPKHYYDDVKASAYDDAELLYYPKWFTVMRQDLELREQQGDITPDPQRFISLYAERIANETLRSAFLTRYLKLTLAAGYSDNFPSFLQQAKAAVSQPTPDFLSRLDELNARYAELRKAVEGITRGTAAPAFTGVDVNGNSYSSADYAGKVWVLDFWFSGCIPCKAEMPHMERLAEEMKGKDIQFFTLSLDSGEQLLKAWGNLVKDKGNSPTLHLNIPGGFKSELARHFGIRSVPRIVVVDREGKIVDAFARRPSDPKLRCLLLQLLGEAPSYPNPLTKEEAAAAMREVSSAATANEKEELMKAFVERVKREKADFAYPMANMMLSLVIEALYMDGQTEKADQYAAQLSESAFKRDILFMAGVKCYENGRLESAERLMGEAAQMTLRLNEGKELSKEEWLKYPVLFSMYAETLVKNGHTGEAAPYVRLAREYTANPGFSLNRDYAAVLMYEKNYTEATPLLEEMIRNGTNSEQHIDWLKEAYTATHGSGKGFDRYLNGLQDTARRQLQEKLAQAMVNEPAPDFTLTNLDGESVSLHALKGKVIVLDFWATWCGPCKASFPAMQKAARHFEGRKDVAFLFICTLESKKNLQEIVRAYMNEHGYNFNVLFDTQDPATRKHRVANSYQVKGIPAKFIIDREGNIRFKPMGFSGSEEETVEELKAMIKSLL